MQEFDLHLAMSTYDGMSVFHIIYDKFSILEQLHLQLMGSPYPGEVSLDDDN